MPESTWKGPRCVYNGSEAKILTCLSGMVISPKATISGRRILLNIF